jgi:hypothetical protein
MLCVAAWQQRACKHKQHLYISKNSRPWNFSYTCVGYPLWARIVVGATWLSPAKAESQGDSQSHTGLVPFGRYELSKLVAAPRSLVRCLVQIGMIF